MARRGRDEEGVATAEPGADVAWLMAQGYAWQRNEDGSISYWKHTPGERDTAMRERRDAGDADARRAPAKSDTP